MTTDHPIDELMHRWETARQDGRDVLPEELCADCTEFVGELAARIHAVTNMESVLGVSHPDPRLTVHGPTEIAHADAEPLPRIPGYDVLRIIDQGGMGVVYEARQLKPSRTVALKMISNARAGPKAIARFRTEAEAAARLLHPNFVQIFQVDEVKGRPFFSMEYVTGGSLAQLLTRETLTPRKSAELVETLAKAAHFAHEHGIVHRDLKPGNVMLAADGTPKIADFGLAKRLDDDSAQTHTGEILGTPSYMAPEQAEGKKELIGPATDVYALGAILYELLAGRPPFQGISPLDSLRQVVANEPTPPSRFAVGVPRDLEAICLKCLEKSPGQRYTSAHALADDLRRFLHGQPVTARHIGPIRRAGKAARRHPQAVALALALFVLACVGLGYLIALFRTPDQALENIEETKQRLRQKAEEQAPLVREILQRNCYECHGDEFNIVEKNLDILNHQQLVDSVRRIVVPGSPGDSRLIQRIADGSMPPEEEELRLPRVSEKELTILTDWILGGAPPLPPVDPQAPVSSAEPSSKLAAQTKEIFHKHCYECHKSAKAESGIKIMHHRLLVTVRKVVVPGKPEESELFKLLTTDDEEARMPPGKRKRLSEQEIDVVRRWIVEGALPFPKTE